jgi:hypothetical protein
MTLDVYWRFSVTTTTTRTSRVRRKLRDWNVGEGRSSPVDGAAPDGDGAVSGDAVSGDRALPESSAEGTPAEEPPVALGLARPEAEAPVPAPGEAAVDPFPIPIPTPVPGSRPSASESVTVGGGPVMDPRMRRRRLDVERAIGRRRLVAGGSVLAAATLVAAGVGILHTPLLGARHIRITGGRGADEARLLAAAGLARDEPLIDVSATAAADGLQALPWVATATVRRAWPATVRVTVSWRHAVAQMPTGPSLTGTMAEIDSTGRIVARVTHAVAGLPVLIGLGPPPAPGEWVSGSAGAGHPIGSTATHPLAVAAALATANGAVEGALGLAAGFAAVGADQGLSSIRSRTVVVRVAAGRTISAEVTPGPVSVLFGTPTALAAKLDALVSVLRSEHLAADSVLDLQVPDRPTVTAGAGAALSP